jgi:hypothetical protein
MINKTILSPAIYFFENQDFFLKQAFKEVKEEIIDKKSITNFKINKKDYTFYINLTDEREIIFLKGKYNIEQLKKIDNSDIIFKTIMKLQHSKEHKENITEYITLFNKTYQPQYNSYKYLKQDHYATLNNEYFQDFCEIFKDKYGEILYSIYKKERESVILTFNYLVNDICKNFDNNKFLSKDINIEDFFETSTYCKIDNLLVGYGDSFVNIIEIKKDKFNLYEIDKDNYNSTLTEEEYEDPNTIFFDQEDFFNKIECIKKMLPQYKVAEISSSSFGDSSFITNSIDKLLITNEYLCKKYDIYNKEKKLIPSDLMFINHTLLSASYYDYVWYEDSLYNANKIIGINYDHLNDFIKKPNEENLVACSTPLLFNYSDKINLEWKTAINETIKKAELIVESQIENSEIFKISSKNLIDIKNYNNEKINKGNLKC